MYDEVTNQLENWLTTSLVPNVSTVISGLSSGLLSVVLALKNILIGVIVMVYPVKHKRDSFPQGKKIITVCFPLRIANQFIEELRFVHRVFGGFITVSCWIPDYRHYLLCLLKLDEDAVRTAGQRDRGDECDSVFRPVYRSCPERLFNSSGEPDEVSVFPDFHRTSSAV